MSKKGKEEERGVLEISDNTEEILEPRRRSILRTWHWLPPL
jgi:hypothetical protein